MPQREALPVTDFARVHLKMKPKECVNLSVIVHAFGFINLQLFG